MTALQCVLLLLDRGARVDYKTAPGGSTPLHLVCEGLPAPAATTAAVLATTAVACAASNATAQVSWRYAMAIRMTHRAKQHCSEVLY
jgi:hypothetical protein